MHVTMSLWTHCYKYCIRIWNNPGIDRILKNQISGRKRTCKNRYLEYWFSQFKYFKGFIKKNKKKYHQIYPFPVSFVFAHCICECVRGIFVLYQYRDRTRNNWSNKALCPNFQGWRPRELRRAKVFFFVCPKSSPIIVFFLQILLCCWLSHCFCNDFFLKKKYNKCNFYKKTKLQSGLLKVDSEAKFQGLQQSVANNFFWWTSTNINTIWIWIRLLFLTPLVRNMNKNIFCKIYSQI